MWTYVVYALSISRLNSWKLHNCIERVILRSVRRGNDAICVVKMFYPNGANGVVGTIGVLGDRRDQLSGIHRCRRLGRGHQ